MTTAVQALPRYSELPLLEGLPLRHAWGLFGPEDEFGTLNLLDGATVRQGLAAALTGERIALTMPLSSPDPPLYGREELRRSYIQLNRNEWDDRLDSFYTQASSQWDSFRHVRCREYGYYGGVTADPPGMGERLSIHHWACGIIGRGVLLDVARHLETRGAPYDAFGDFAISADVLRETAEAQGTPILPGDILCIRVGWQRAYGLLSPEQRAQRAAAGTAAAHAGLSGSEAVAELLWDWHVAAVTCDNPSVETSPGDPAIGSLHRRILPLLGIPMGELLDFEELAHRSAADGRWTFAFIGVPLNMPGGVGSPANAVAVR